MTTSMMGEQLVVLFDRLEREGQAALAEIYTLVSPHLNGIIMRVLKDEANSADVLKAVFKKIWDVRPEGYSTNDPLSALRAIALRYALNFKYTGNTEISKDTLLELRTKVDHTRVPLMQLPEANVKMLRGAYLAGRANGRSLNQDDIKSDKVKKTIIEFVSKSARGAS